MATATAAGLVPVVTFTGGVTAVLATASAAAPIPAFAYGGSITALSATATATALTPATDIPATGGAKAGSRTLMGAGV